MPQISCHKKVEKLKISLLLAHNYGHSMSMTLHIVGKRMQKGHVRVRTSILLWAELEYNGRYCFRADPGVGNETLKKIDRPLYSLV